MTLSRAVIFALVQVVILGAAAFAGFRVGFRSAYWRGVARGMHLVQTAAMQIANGQVPNFSTGDDLDIRRRRSN